jgi:hypothetical protein
MQPIIPQHGNALACSDSASAAATGLRSEGTGASSPIAIHHTESCQYDNDMVLLRDVQRPLKTVFKHIKPRNQSTGLFSVYSEATLSSALNWSTAGRLLDAITLSSAWMGRRMKCLSLCLGLRHSAARTGVRPWLRSHASKAL